MVHAMLQLRPSASGASSSALCALPEAAAAARCAAVKVSNGGQPLRLPGCCRLQCAGAAPAEKGRSRRPPKWRPCGAGQEDETSGRPSEHGDGCARPAREAVGKVQTGSRRQTHVPKPKSQRQVGLLEDQRLVPLAQQLEFERKGHICVRGLLSPSEAAMAAPDLLAAADRSMLQALRHRVEVLCPGADPLSVNDVRAAEKLLQRKAVDKVGFLQIFNLHRTCPTAHRLATSQRLAGAAAALLGVNKVKLYQDCLFLKQPGFGATNWHSDLNMVPLDTSSFLTVWLPLRDLTAQDSSLLFATGSHRDFALPYWKNNEGMMDLQSRGYPLETYSRLKLGDATFHHGWTLHWAPVQPPGSLARHAFTVSYFADGAKVLSTKNCRRDLHGEDSESYRQWRKDLREGQIASHHLLPVVYSKHR